MQASLRVHLEERSRFIWSTLRHLGREPRFRHQWRTADHLATLCHKWFTIPEPLKFDGKDLNNALLKDPAMKLDIEAEKSDLFGMTENWRVALLVQSHVILLMTTSKCIYVLYVKQCIIRQYK
jgi:hypothetical protein